MPGDHPSVIGYVPASQTLAGRPILDLTKAPTPLRGADGARRVAGIDVSHYQGDVDWQQVASVGVRFVFIKATEGRNKPDRRFADNWDESSDAGLYTGAYHFMRATSSGKVQAQRFLDAVADSYETERALPPVLDLETAGLKPEEVVTWLDEVRTELGWTPLVYLNFDFATRFAFPAPTFGAFPLWFAQYPLRFRDNGRPFEPLRINKQKTWKDWAFWQYSETGNVPGIDGYVDLDVFHGSLADLEAWRSRHKNASP